LVGSHRTFGGFELSSVLLVGSHRTSLAFTSPIPHPRVTLPANQRPSYRAGLAANSAGPSILVGFTAQPRADPQLVLHAVERLDVHACEGPARRRATCGVLVSIMPINSCPASRTGPLSLAGSTARLRINPASSCAQRRDSSMLLASRSNSLPRRLRVPFETRHESWSDGAGPASSATRMCGRSDHSSIHHHCFSSCRCNVLVHTRLRSNLAWRGVLGSQQRLLRDGFFTLACSLLRLQTYQPNPTTVQFPGPTPPPV